MLIRRWPLIPFGRLLSYSLMLISPTVLALDALVFLRDLDINFAIWVVAGTMVGAIAVAWLFLGDLSDMAIYTQRVALGDRNEIPELRSGVVRDLARAVNQLDYRWRRRVDAFSRSINTDIQILETLHDPLVLIDGQGRIIRANAAARALFGRSLAEELIETAISSFELLQAVRRALEWKELIGLGVTLTGHGAGERRFEARVMPIESEAEDHLIDDNISAPPLIAVVVTLHETTELWRAAELRERFIANVSHELRTPLASIVGFIETLLGPAKEDMDVRERFLKIMNDQAARMTRIVADLLHLSRLEQELDLLPTEEVNLARLLTGVEESLQLKAAEENLRISIQAEPDLPSVYGDYDQLFQVFQNLLDNAIKYSKPDTTIVLAVSFDGKRLLEVAVSDEGEGIAPEHIPHLGERFYRVDRARSRHTGGSGLGLAIVFSVLARHRGQLKIESEPGKGSTFRVTLPVTGQAGGA